MMNKEYIIEKGNLNDLDELENLYNELNDFLSSNINYPGWIKGVYPIRETALNGIQQDNLFVLRIGDTITGSIILNHEPEQAYEQVKWGLEADYKDVIVIHTLVVKPSFMKQEIASRLMEFSKEYSIQQNMKTIRLDVSIKNTPAIHLYERHGYQYVGTVDLGLNVPGLVWFKLYEIIL